MQQPGCTTTRSPIKLFVIEALAPIAHSRPTRTSGPITAFGPIVEYNVILNPDGLRLVRKGHRKADVELRWADLLGGEAALAAALNASLQDKSGGQAAAKDDA